MKIFCDSGLRRGCIIFEGEKPILISYECQTTNIGEYKIVILALEEILRRGLRSVVILSDSELLVKQVSGEYRCLKAHLIPLRERVRALAQDLQSTVEWVSRNENPAGKKLG